MNRRVNWLVLLACAGAAFPGIVYPEVRELLDWEERRTAAAARGYPNLPPANGPERLEAVDLSDVEWELWQCIRGAHGAECSGSS